jgi:hypothetical protein
VTYRSGLLWSFLAATLGLLLGGIILLAVDPMTADALVVAAFFTSIFLVLAGLAVPILFWGRTTAGNREVVFANFPIALRQGVLVASTLTVLLILQAVRALSWWDAVLVVAAAGFIELAFRSRT